MKKPTAHLLSFDRMSDCEYGYVIAGIGNLQFQKTPGTFKMKTIG